MDAKTLQHTTMEAHKSEDFSLSFQSSKSSREIYKLLLQLEKWWTGLYGETITGQSQKLGDEFEFLAGGGAHYTKQKLIELVPNEIVIWEVTDCNLRFVTQHTEWVGTQIYFQIEDQGSSRKVTFKHIGLTPKFECYGSCSGAWTEYMVALESKLK